MNENIIAVATELAKLGIRSAESKVMASLMFATDKKIVPEICEETGLWQPHVSVAMRPLVDQGWVARSEVMVHTGTIMRKVNTYSLAMHSEDLINVIANGKTEDIIAVQSNILRILHDAKHSENR